MGLLIKNNFIETKNAPFKNLSINILIIPNNGLTLNISRINASITNLCTSVNDLGNIETNARARAESNSPPGPNNPDGKSSWTWSIIAPQWAVGIPPAINNEVQLSSKNWAITSKNWAESSSAPGGGNTKSAKTWSTTAQNWAESNNAPGGRSRNI